MKSFYKKGITAIELLVVIIVLGIVFSIVIPQFSKMRESQVFKNGVEEIISSINKARSQTLASKNSSSYGVHFESDKVIIFTGEVFSDTAMSNEAVDISTPASITDVTLNGISGNSGNIYFNRLSGAPDKTGTITISTANYSKIITISAVGAASVN